MFARALIALLLVLNLTVALWLVLRPTQQPEPLPPLRGEAASLVLLSEEPQLPENAMAAAAEPDGPPTPSLAPEQLVCLEIGPFLTQADLRRALNRLTPDAERIQFRETRALARRGFQVYLPAQASRAVALTTARELAAKGVRDYYVVTAGERENTISLGLFQSQENARKRHAEVRALGFDALLQTRTDEIPSYWIDLAGASTLDWQARVANYSGVTANTVDCR